MFKKFQALGKVISSVKPNVPKTQIEKKIRDLKIETQKLKGSGKKLDQTVFEIQNKKPITFKKDKTKTLSNSQKARKGKMGGGFMGKRMGYKKGSKFPDLTGDGKVTFADILKGRGVINGKKKKK